MKAFKYIVALVVLVPIAFLAGGFLLPKHSHVERSLVIDAEAGKVFAVVGDLRMFDQWDPWSEKDPNMTVSYSGPIIGPGAARHWSGNQEVGTGTMTFIEYEPNERAVMLLDFGEMGEGTATYTLQESDDYKTTITWSFDTTHSNVMERYFGLVLDGMLGKEYEKGLAKLKQVAENLPEIKTEELSYKIKDKEFNAYIAYPAGLLDPAPGIIVVHEWWGHNDYARSRAEQLAKEGYAALAIDMYGDGKVANHPKDAAKFMNEVGANTEITSERFEFALKLLKEHYYVDRERVAAIGYCFGGSVVINMAREGKDVLGVASFHGGLGQLTDIDPYKTMPPMLVMNGAEDPFVPEEQKIAFKKEMDLAQARYEFIDYPGVKHSFTNPGADKVGEEFSLPLKYDAEADADSWMRLQEFLKQIFYGKP